MMDTWPKSLGGWPISPSMPSGRSGSKTFRSRDGRPPPGGPSADAGRVPGLDVHLILVGLPGAGKTSIGAGLAKALGSPFVDLDAEIVRQVGRPISAIFAAHGEDHFRSLEREATQRLRGTRPCIVSVGGGWVTVPTTVALLRPPARMVYLKVGVATAARRLHRSARLRPLLRQDPAGALERLLAARQGAYETADLVVDTEGLTRQQVIGRLVSLLRGGPVGS